MPKILRIINRLNIGGPTFNVAYLTKYMDSNFETMLLAGMKDESEASSEHILQKFDIHPVYIKSMHRNLHPIHDLKAYKEIRKIIRTFKPDIVHTHASKPGLVGRLAAYHEKVPIIIHTYHGHAFHSYFSPLKTKLYTAIEKYLAKISTKIIAISNIQKEEITTTYQVCKPDKVAVVSLGFDLNGFQQDTSIKRAVFRTKYKLDDDTIAIGIIGRLVLVKNHQLFIYAIKKILSKTTKKVKFLIIGDGERRDELIHLVDSLRISYSLSDNIKQESNLQFTSWIKNMEEVYAGLDIIALTSLNEGTPVTLIEAQAANKPIISTDVGGIRDIVLPGKNALLVKSNDLAAFSDKLLQLIEDDNMRIAFSKNGSENVLDRFNYTSLVHNMGKVYQELLNI